MMSLSTNNGSSWTSLDAGIPFSPSGRPIVSWLEVIGTNIFVSAAGYLWERPLSDFGTSAVSLTSPIENSVTNFPNPFTQSTTITFTTPEGGVADVNVVNVLGTEVARIFSGELSAGEHSFSWDANGLPDGVYECIVQLNGSVERVPIVLAK
jgi:hypothetical protein